MAAGDDHDIRRFIRSEPRHGLFEIFGDDFLGFGEAFAVGVSFAVVDYGDVETSIFGDLVKIHWTRGLRRKYKVTLEVGPAR